jgi:hypothetical protein
MNVTAGGIFSDWRSSFIHFLNKMNFVFSHWKRFSNDESGQSFWQKTER